MIEFNRGNNNCISMSGVGYVIIPDNTDAATYVQRCYRNHTVSVGNGYGSSPMHNVKITEDALNRVKFPCGDKGGSAVVWLRDSFTNRPIVIGVLKSYESCLIDRYQQRICQEIGNQVCEIFIDAMNSRINITSLGNENVPAEVTVKASSGKGEGDAVNVVSKDKVVLEGKTLKVNLSNDVDFTINNGEKDLIKVTGDEDEYRMKDSWGNEFILNKDNCQIITNKFNVGNGGEPMVLGNTLVDLLKRLIDAILSMTVLTHAGASGTPINAPTFSKIKGELETILSKLSNTD